MVDLSRYSAGGYDPGRGLVVRSLWFFVGLPLLRAAWNPSSAFRTFLLRLFGARIGRRAVLRPGMRVKNPWRLRMGDDCWIGEDAWIDNLVPVTLGNSVVISQGAYLCTGNHDWSAATFDLRTGPIQLDDGAWVAARAMLLPGVTLGACAVAAAGSVVVHSIPPFEIHAGNPASFSRRRRIQEHGQSASPELKSR